MDLTEAEDIKKRWQEHTEELEEQEKEKQEEKISGTCRAQRCSERINISEPRFK